MNPNNNPIAEGEAVTVPANMPAVQSTTTEKVTTLETPTTSATTSTTTVVQAKKKPSCLLWCFGQGTVFLLILICCICSVGVWLPQTIKSSTVTGGFNKSDYAHIQASDVKTTDKTVENKISDAQDLTDGAAYSVTLTEEEVLNYIFSQNTDSKDIADGVYLNFDNGNKASLRIELSSVLKNSESSNLNPDDFKDIFIGVDFTIGSDGKSLTVDKVTSGNQFIDSIAAESFKESIQSSINEALTNINSTDNPNADYVLKSIKITDGEITISYDPKTGTTVTPTSSNNPY